MKNTKFLGGLLMCPHYDSVTLWVPQPTFGEGNGTPLQYSCLENPMDGEAWWAAVSGVAQSWTRLKRLSSSSRVFMKPLHSTCVHPMFPLLLTCPTPVTPGHPFVVRFDWERLLEGTWERAHSAEVGLCSFSIVSSAVLIPGR